MGTFTLTRVHFYPMYTGRHSSRYLIFMQYMIRNVFQARCLFYLGHERCFIHEWITFSRPWTNKPARITLNVLFSSLLVLNHLKRFLIRSCSVLHAHWLNSDEYAFAKSLISINKLQERDRLCSVDSFSNYNESFCENA